MVHSRREALYVMETHFMASVLGQPSAQLYDFTRACPAATIRERGQQRIEGNHSLILQGLDFVQWADHLNPVQVAYSRLRFWTTEATGISVKSASIHSKRHVSDVQRVHVRLSRACADGPATNIQLAMCSPLWKALHQCISIN